MNPKPPSRLALVKQGLETGVGKRGRLVVGIAKIIEDPRNERKVYRNMEGLVASIQALGLIEPITVTPEEVGGTYRIITGHRRYRAAKAAGLETIEVLIRDPEDERQRRLKSIVSNVQREDIGPIDMAEALQVLMDEEEQIATQEDLARLIGKDEPWVSGMLRLLTLPSQLQKKVGLTQLSVPYDAMIRIARLDDPQAQEELIDALLGGATQREIRDRINAKKGKPARQKSEPITKPKQVYYTSHQAAVIIQSQTETLSHDQVVQALEEALTQARDEQVVEVA